MKKIVSVEEMRAKEKFAIEVVGIPSIVLMENAGRKIADIVIELIGKKKLKKPDVCVFCGSGNNAGDGFVAARHLHNNGYDVEIVMVKNENDLKGDALTNYKIIKNLGIRIKNIAEYNSRKKKNCIIIDALLGTGIRGDVSYVYKNAINFINGSSAFVVSADIPSGLDADTGQPRDQAVKASVTITMGAVKKGLITKTGRKFCGKIVVADIGVKII